MTQTKKICFTKMLPALIISLLISPVSFSSDKGAEQPFYVVTPKNSIHNKVNIEVRGDYRYIESNGIPAVHGTYPAPYNTGYIMAQNFHFKVPVNPTLSKKTTPLIKFGITFGVTLTGIPFMPFDAEYWKDDATCGWHYVALEANKGDVNVDIDFNNGHTHPIGVYHYHGLPLDIYNKSAQYHGAPAKMVLIGYAADGFPIYGLYAYKNADDASSTLTLMHSSYQLKKGNRPSSGPKGAYDGTFVQDYQFIKGSGDLDECNGRSGVTPEYPNGTYYYMISPKFPTVGRCFKGKPDKSFSDAAIGLAAPTTYSVCSTLNNPEERLKAGCPNCSLPDLKGEERDKLCPKDYTGR